MADGTSSVGPVAGARRVGRITNVICGPKIGASSTNRVFEATWLDAYTKSNRINFAISLDSKLDQSFAVGRSALMTGFSRNRQATSTENFNLFIYLLNNTVCVRMQFEVQQTHWNWLAVYLILLA